jgi:hypothetical protein
MRAVSTLRGGLTFLHTEVKTGLLMAEIALAANDEDKFKRTRKNAHKAYESATYFLDRTSVPEEDSGQLQRKLAELRDRLRILYESHKIGEM